MSSTPADPQDRAALDRLMRGFQVSRMIRAVADVALADRIGADASRGIDELAAECGVQPLPLLRIVRALAGCGVFRVSAAGEVAHSPLSLWLRTDTPGSLHHGARFWTQPGNWRAWEKLDAALAGGVPHHAAWQTGRFDYLRSHPDEARIFDAFMAHFPDDRQRALAEAYDFSGARLIADIGGGNGEALRQILARFPNARGLVFDREDVVNAIPSEARMQGRIDVQGGDFLVSVPRGADICVLMRVLHDWSDDDCRRILANCRAAMATGARLLICEQLLEADPSRANPLLYLLDIQMMVSFGAARERTEDEFRMLLASADFALRRAIPTSGPVFVLEAHAV